MPTSHHGLSRIFQKRRFRKLLATSVLSGLIIGIVIVPIERGQGGPIQTYFDGIWWAVSTITTIGYGDYVPTTIEGRMIGMVLQVIGAFSYGLLVAMIATSLDKSQDEFQWKRTRERLDGIEQRLIHLQKDIEYLVKKEKK